MMYVKEIAVAVVILVVCGYLVAIQPSRLKKWLLDVCFEAEKIYKSKTGQKKLGYVYRKFVDRFKFLGNIIPYSMFNKIVGNLVEEMTQMIKDSTELENLLYEGKEEEK